MHIAQLKLTFKSTNFHSHEKTSIKQHRCWKTREKVLQACDCSKPSQMMTESINYLSYGEGWVYFHVADSHNNT